MTDGQLAAILSLIGTALAGLIGVMRWGVGRITNSLDNNTLAYRESAKAQLEAATKFAELATKIDGIADWVHDHTPVDFEAPPTKPGRASTRVRTNPHGYRPPCPGEHND